jgi:triphosphoribosyl-dephospho-CoA synthase
MNRKLIDELSFKLAECAQKSILYEAILTPKPGLVDAVDSGAHKDMDIYTFIDSSTSLFKGFYSYAKSGLTCTQDEKELFKIIRDIGIIVEKDMFKATDNVNTHKGINFSLGIVVAATGYYLRYLDKEQIDHFKPEDTLHILNIVERMTEGLVKNDFRDLDKKEKLTNGERIYLEKGFSGIRGEVERGFPTVVNISLPRLRFLSNNNIKKDRLLLDVLFHIMSVSIDSNVINRGGFNTLEFVNEEALKFIEEGIIYQENYQEKIEVLNNVFIEKNISPGGAADLLAITIFFALLESIL